jgi:hypothetical protein
MNRKIIKKRIKKEKRRSKEIIERKNYKNDRKGIKIMKYIDEDKYY